MMLCNICKSESYPFLSKDGYDLWQCRKCHLVFVNPQPKKEYIKRELYSEESGYQGNKSKNLNGLKPTNKQKEILKILLSLKKGKLLDIGCSSGEFMWLAKKAGFDVVGVELNERTARIARENGLDVYSGFIEDIKFPLKSFDYVYMGDLIEHVSDPSNLIESVRGLLKNKGHLIVVTPNLDCFWSKSTFLLYRFFNIPWSSLTPPHHLYQFSIENLDLLMFKYSFKNVWSKFFLPPSLKYELGSLHLYKKYKQDKNIKSFLYMWFSFILYTKLYILNWLLQPFHKKDFQMSVVYSLDINDYEQ